MRLLSYLIIVLAIVLWHEEGFSKVRLGINFLKFETPKELSYLRESLEKTVYHHFLASEFITPKVVKTSKDLKELDYLLSVEMRIESPKSFSKFEVFRLTKEGGFQKVYEKGEELESGQIFSHISQRCEEIRNLILSLSQRERAQSLSPSLESKSEKGSFLSSLNPLKGIFSFFANLFQKEDEFKISVPIPPPPSPPFNLVSEIYTPTQRPIKIPFFSSRKEENLSRVFNLEPSTKNLGTVNQVYGECKWEWF